MASVYLLVHSASSTEWMLSYLTPLAMSTRLFLFSKITQLLTAILTTTMPEKQHAELRAIYGSTVIDRSTLYSGFSDLNEYLVNISFTQNKIANENK